VCIKSLKLFLLNLLANHPKQTKSFKPLRHPKYIKNIKCYQLHVYSPSLPFSNNILDFAILRLKFEFLYVIYLIRLAKIDLNFVQDKCKCQNCTKFLHKTNILAKFANCFCKWQMYLLKLNIVLHKTNV
jgi:hypothetical protein